MDLRHITRRSIEEIKRDDRLFQRRGNYLVCVNILEDGAECGRKPEYFLERRDGVGTSPNEEVPYCRTCDKR